jgi:BTB/POZ domain
MQHQQIIYIHKIMLRYRCPTMVHMIFGLEENNLTVQNQRLTHTDAALDEMMTPHRIVLQDLHQLDAMKLILEYLYTGIINITSYEMAVVVQEFAKKYDIPSLLHDVTKHIDRHVRNRNDTNTHANKTKNETNDNVMNHQNLWHSSSLSFKCQISNIDALTNDLCEMARCVATTHSEFVSYLYLQDVLQCSDITIQWTGDYTWSLHRFRLCPQSDYFKAAFHGGFQETKNSLLDLSHMVSYPETIRLTIQYMYCNTLLDPPSTIPVAIEILQFGSFLMCPPLSIHVANHFLVAVIDEMNVWDFLNLARLYQLDRFEECCVDYVGCNFLSFSQNPKLRSILSEEMSSTIQGGDVTIVDIPIATEIKRAIHKASSLTVDQKRISLTTLRSLLSDIAGVEINWLS